MWLSCLDPFGKKNDKYRTHKFGQFLLLRSEAPFLGRNVDTFGHVVGLVLLVIIDIFRRNESGASLQISLIVEEVLMKSTLLLVPRGEAVVIPLVVSRNPSHGSMVGR